MRARKKRKPQFKVMFAFGECWDCITVPVCPNYYCPKAHLRKPLDFDLERLKDAAAAGGTGVDLNKLSDDEIINHLMMRDKDSSSKADKSNAA